MAKDTSGEAPLKKKRHGCRNCLFATLILIVVFNVALYFTGNFFTQKYLNTSLMDCFKVLFDLTHSNQKKIVTNGYSKREFAKFESDVKKELFIKEDAHFSLSELMDALIESVEENEVQETGEPLQAQSPARDVTVSTDRLVEKLVEVFVRGNMDLDRLREYDESRHDEYILYVSDKMLASALGRSVDALGRGIAEIGEFLSGYSFKSLSSILRVDQLTLGTKKGIKAGESAKVKTMKLTVSLNARPLVQQLLKKNTGKKFAFLTKLFLPKRFYVTAEVPIEENATIQNAVHLNNMNNKQMARTYKVIDGIMRRASGKGNATSVRKRVEDVVNGSVAKAIQKVERVFPLSKAEKGKVPFDVFETVIDLTGINEDKNGKEKPAEEQLHAADLIKTIAGLVASDLEEGLKPEYDFQHQYFDSKENKVVYKKTVTGEGYTWVDYKQLFMEELETKYLLDFSLGNDDPNDDVTFDDLMKLFGLGEHSDAARDLELSKLLDGRKLHDLVCGDKSLMACIDSRMLGAILKTQIDTLLPKDGTLGSLSPDLEYVYTYVFNGRNMMEAAFSFDVSSLLDGHKNVAKIVSGLLGERALLALTVDITPKSSGGTYAESTLSYNGLTAEKTNDILRTINVFVSDFSYDEILKQIVDPVRDAINNMSQKIPIRIRSSVIDVDETKANLPPAIELGSVYEIIKQFIFEEDDVTAEDIQKVLEKLEASDSEYHFDFESKFVGSAAISDTYYASLQEVLKAYYVHGVEEDASFDDVFGEDGILSEFDADRIDFDELFHDKRFPATTPHFTQGDLAALMLDKMKADDALANSPKLYAYLQKVRGARIASAKSTATERGTVTLIIALNVADDLLGAASQDKAQLLPTDVVYLTATVYIGEEDTYKQESNDHVQGVETKYYRTVFSVNGMTDDEFAAFRIMLDSLNKQSGNAPLDFDVKAKDIGAIVYRELKTVEDALGSEIVCGDGHVVLPSVYDYIRVALGVEDANPEFVRAALQGLAERREDSSPYNYDAPMFNVNPVQEEGVTLSAASLSEALTLPDNAFGKALKDGFTVNVPGESYTVNGVLPDTDVYKLQQFNVLTADDTNERTVTRHNGLSAYPDGLGSRTDKTTYLEFTFVVNLKALASRESKLFTKLPTQAYITVLFEQTEAGSLEFLYYRLNNIPAAALSVLLRMAKIDEEGINTQITRCATALSKYNDVSFGPSTEDSDTAFGTVTFYPSNVRA